MVLADDTIPQSWDVTSDSLAAWLAQKLDAQHLILIKSDKPEENKLNLKLIKKDGLLDEAFCDFGLNKDFSPWVVKKGDFTHFEEGVDSEILGKVGSSIH